MRVAITGASGYLGSRLAAALKHLGFAVVAIGRGRRSPFLDDLGIDQRTWDDPHALDGIMSVVHAAACYGRNDEKAAELVLANVSLPLGLLERACQAGISQWLTIGTALPESLSPYSRSKHQFLAWAEAQTRIPHTWVASEHFFGPHDSGHKFLTRCLNAFRRGDATLPLTRGDQRRDFIYIDDVVSALAFILTKPTSCHRRLPLGTGRAVPVRDAVRTLHRLCHAGTQLAFGAVPLRPDEPTECIADPRPLASLGWQTSISLEDGLARMVSAEECAAT